jgi:hypothetical protein
MSQLNLSILRNNPVWDNNAGTFVGVLPVGGAVGVPLSGSYFVLSNTGANNLFVSTDATLGTGILVAPGQSFESACLAGVSIGVIGTAGQPFVLVQFS